MGDYLGSSKRCPMADIKDVPQIPLSIRPLTEDGGKINLRSDRYGTR
jgi:hypothetical protein